MKKRFYSLLVLGLMLAPGALNAEQCAGYVQWPRWVWKDDMEWVSYLGPAGDNDINDATYGWMVQTSNTFFIQPSIRWEDLLFETAPLPAGIVGNNIPHTQQENSGCYLKTDYCGICMNAAVFYWDELQFDAVQLTDQVQAYQQEGFPNLTFDLALTQAMSHELGHAMREGELGLAISQIQNCAATSIMGTLDVNIRCGNYLAQQCDGETWQSAYSGWLYDAQVCEDNPYCDAGFGQGGQSCT